MILAVLYSQWHLQVILEGGVVWRRDQDAFACSSYTEEKHVQNGAAANQAGEIVCFHVNPLQNECRIACKHVTEHVLQKWLGMPA